MVGKKKRFCPISAMYVLTLTLYVTPTVNQPIVKKYVAIKFRYTLSSIISSLIEERTNKMQRWLDTYFLFYFAYFIIVLFLTAVITPTPSL